MKVYLEHNSEILPSLHVQNTDYKLSKFRQFSEEKKIRADRWTAAETCSTYIIHQCLRECYAIKCELNGRRDLEEREQRFDKKYCNRD